MGSPIAPKTKNQNKDEWETPTCIYNALHSEFNFNIDAFATKENAKCKAFYTKEDSAYDHEPMWASIFMNPPYSDLYRAVDWALQNAKRNIIVMLLPVKTDNDWWGRLLSSKAELRFYRKRLAFAYKNIPMTGCPFTSMAVVLRRG